MLIQRLKKYKPLYLFAVILLAVSLLVIFFHQHTNNLSRNNCPICKIAKDIASSKVLEPFCQTFQNSVATVRAIVIFSPVIVPLLLSQNSRASPHS